MSSVNSRVTGRKFTKFLHDIEASFTLLMRTLRYSDIPFRFGMPERRKFAMLFHKLGCHCNVSDSYNIKKYRDGANERSPVLCRKVRL